MKKYCFTFLLAAASLVAFSQPTVGFTSIITGLTAPVDIVNAKDSSHRLFIVQQNGIVRIYSGSGLLTTPFLNMSSLITYTTGGEQGLLSIAFHPKYATNRYFFVYYNNLAGDVELAQYRTLASDSNRADTASRKILLTIAKPYVNHNGCKLNFGPDSNLYFGTGDGGSGGDPFNNAQNLNSYLGKMLRINVDSFNTAPYYAVPATNPLVGVSNTKSEIYGWGLRNPWRWSFDRQNGDMWIADVGQGAWEEVNMIPAASTSGINYGWRCYEGNHSYDLSLCGSTPLSGKTFPIFEYGHNSAGGYSITGGLVYRGTQYPVLQGYYICADYVTTNGWLIKPNTSSGWTVIQQTNFPNNVSTFGDAEDGTLYLATLGGTIYQVTATGNPLSVKMISFKANTKNGQDILSWNASPDQTLTLFEVQQSTDGTHYNTIGTLLPQTETADYHFVTTELPVDRFYRLKMIYNNSNTGYSAVVRLLPGQLTENISVSIGAGKVRLTTPVALESVRLINMEGRRLQSFENLSAGMHILNTDNAAPGIYVLECIKKDRSVEKLRLSLY